MCMFKTPKMPDAPPERQAARAPASPGASAPGVAADVARRRLAMASSIFTAPTLGAPNTTAPLGA